MSFEISENKQPLEEHEKEEALIKSKVFKMRQVIQAELIQEKKSKIDKEALKAWVDDHSASDYEHAFDEVMIEHPDLLDKYEHNKREAKTLVLEKFDQIHHEAA